MSELDALRTEVGELREEVGTLRELARVLLLSDSAKNDALRQYLYSSTDLPKA